MLKKRIALGLGLCVVLAAIVVMGQQPAAKTEKTGAPDAKIARGKYIVERVGICADCHTPVTKTGEPDRTKWLQGAPIMFKPTVPLPKWEDFAPPLAGMDWTEEQLAKFLQTGLDPKGEHADPPMPPYRLNKTDAAAVAAYLKSLPAPKK